MKKVYLLATVVAILTGFTVYLFATEFANKNQPPVVNYEMVSVVAAASDIPVNTKITADMLIMVEIPKEAVAPGAVKDMEKLVGKTTKYPIYKGEMFVGNKAIDVGDNSNSRLSERIRTGYRAYTISTDEVAGIAGYLRVGDRVDIMVTIDVPVENSDVVSDETEETQTETITYYLMQNVPVIAVGSASQYINGVTELNSYMNITLEVLAEDCTMLDYNVTHGFIKIVLRGFNDNDEAGRAVYKMEEAGVWKN